LIPLAEFGLNATVGQPLQGPYIPCLIIHRLWGKE
jgi:hypothetical protein